MSNSHSRQNDTATELDEEKNISEHHKNKNNAHPSKSYISNLPDAKWIYIYLNGDEHFSGCRCVVNYKHYRNLDMFLNYLTERIKPSFGALRNIYTPVNGHPVLKLEDLVSKHKYVVAGNERFRKLDLGYTDIVDRRLKRNGAIPKNIFKVSKAKPLCYKALNVYLYQTGNFKEKPYKINLHSQDLESWELVFKNIMENIKCGPIKSPNQSSRKSSSVIIARSSAIYSRASTRVSEKYSQNHDSCSVTKSSSAQKEHSAHSLNITEMGNGVESDSFNPVKSKDTYLFPTKAKINLDDDYSGLFRSKYQNDLTVGALEIEDSLETIIDVPVDLLDAEEVEDEITPDMERSMQHLSLDVPEKIVAYLPTIQNKTNSNERHVSANKYNLNPSQTIDVHNVYV